MVGVASVSQMGWKLSSVGTYTHDQSSLEFFFVKILNKVFRGNFTSTLERYIANIASLDRWLANFGNNCVWWSMNLKNIGSDGLATKLHRWQWFHLKNENHANQPTIVNNHIIEKHRQRWHAWSHFNFVPFSPLKNAIDKHTPDPHWNFFLKIFINY